MSNSHEKPWGIGIQFADEAMGTQNLCGLPDTKYKISELG